MLTVLPGTIERVTIEPAHVVRNPGNAFSFTAIGHYPDGTTINVTQVVTWATLSPDVAEATNEPGNRSRIHALDTGVSPVTARHPSGMSSHDTGDDATFEVQPARRPDAVPGVARRARSAWSRSTRSSAPSTMRARST